MWKQKTFKSAAALAAWIEANRHRFQIQEVAINNGWGVIYKRLIRVY